MKDRPSAPYVVFTRSDSPYFWVRFSIPGQGQKRIALKTLDEQDAKRRAEIEYQRAIWAAEQGLLPGKMSFDRIARLYLESAEREAGDHPVKRAKVSADRGVLERYMLPFFGKSPVTAINVPKLHRLHGLAQILLDERSWGQGDAYHLRAAGAQGHPWQLAAPFRLAIGRTIQARPQNGCGLVGPGRCHPTSRWQDAARRRRRSK